MPVTFICRSLHLLYFTLLLFAGKHYNNCPFPQGSASLIFVCQLLQRNFEFESIDFEFESIVFIGVSLASLSPFPRHPLF